MNTSENTPEIAPQATLARKMAQVMGKLRRIAKDGENKDQKWKYATIDDITDAVRGEMADAGLALFVTMLESKTEPGANGKGTIATVILKYKIVCADTGAFEEMIWTGVAGDYSDKAVNKAATYATKFWMKNTFLISTGDDPDAESPAVEPAPKKPAPQPHWSDDTDDVKRLWQRAAERGWIEHESEIFSLIGVTNWRAFNSWNEAALAIKAAGEKLKASKQPPAEKPSSDVIGRKAGEPVFTAPTRYSDDEIERLEREAKHAEMEPTI